MAGLGKNFGEWQLIVPALSARYLAGEIAGNHEIKGTMLRAATAVVLSTGVITGLKYSIGRTRPEVRGKQLPVPALQRRELVPVGAYRGGLRHRHRGRGSDQRRVVGLPALWRRDVTALSRVNDNRHWVSDVLIGGLVGHLSGRWVSGRLGPLRVSPTAVTAGFQF